MICELCKDDEESCSDGELSTDDDELIEVPMVTSIVDKSAGSSGIAVPQAVTDFQGRGVQSDGGPSKWKDLRRYLCPGDIVNILGGNMWGHCCLLLGAKDVRQFRTLYDVEPGTKDTPGKTVELAQDVWVYILDVMQSASDQPSMSTTSMGVTVHPDTKEVCLVSCGGKGVVLKRGHNGLPVVCEIYMSPFSKDTLDGQLFARVAEDVYRSDVGNRWSKQTAVRAYLRKAKLNPDKYKTRESRLKLARLIQNSWSKRPVCSTVPPRVWQRYFQSRCQMPRAALPEENAAGVPVDFGEKGGAHLLYCGREGVVELDDEDDGRDIACFSGPQLDRCGPTRGKQCNDCLQCQWNLPSDEADPQIAFVEDCLRMMPVKDDRVLPKELCATLERTHLWQRLNMRKRVAAHRKCAASSE